MITFHLKTGRVFLTPGYSARIYVQSFLPLLRIILGLDLGFHRSRAFNLSRRLRLRGQDFAGAAPVVDGRACI
jgi:hypothetical protein